MEYNRIRKLVSHLVLTLNGKEGQMFYTIFDLLSIPEAPSKWPTINSYTLRTNTCNNLPTREKKRKKNGKDYHREHS